MEKKHQEKNKKINKILCLIFVIAIIIALILVIRNANIEKLNKLDNLEQLALTEEQIKELKDSIKVNEVSIIGRATGTEPFSEIKEGEVIPEIPEPGEDYSASDNYVRILDVVSYQMNVTTSPNTLKEGITDSSIIYGGIIKVKAKLPNQEEPNLTWELDAWMENPQLSDDGTELYAEYTIPIDQISAPKSQQLSFSFRVGGNTKEITENQMPVFEVWMDGNKPDNEESQVESCVIKDNSIGKISISSSQGLNVKLQKGDLTQKWTNSNELGEKQNGYYMNYGIAVGIAQKSEILNDLRGIEYPVGKLEIKLKLDYEYSDGTEWISVDENSENSLGPANGTKIIAYGINGEKNTNLWPNDSVFVSGMPNGRNDLNLEDEKRNVYDSGNINVKQEGDIITVTFENFNIGENFPELNRSGGAFGTSTEGYFAVGNIEIFSPFYNEISDSITEYQLNISVLEATFSTQTEQDIVIGANDSNGMIEDVNLTDNRLNYAMTRELDNSSVGHSLQIRNESDQIIETSNLNGDAFRSLGDEIIAISSFNANDGPYEGGNERIITWSGDVLEIKKYDENNWYSISESSGLNLPLPSRDNISVKYGVYKTGRNTGIVDDTEINNADYDDFFWYETPEEALNIGKIAAIYIDDPDFNGYRLTRTIRLKFNVIEKEENIGKVAVIRHKNKLYQDVERKKIAFQTSNEYTKSKYNEEGVLISVHTPRNNGNSILILGNKVNVSNTTTDESSSGMAKVNYNVDDGIINYKIIPTLTNDREPVEVDSYIDRVVITNYLPKGLTYKVASANKQPESVNVNPETGETIITWVYENWQVNRDAPEYPEITFSANIDVTVPNNSQLENRTVIYTKNDYRNEEDYRTARYGVLIANLSSLQGTQFFNEPVVELNEKLIATFEIQNFSQVSLTNARALQVLPYVGDENGSDFVGTYKIKIGEIPEGAKLYYTKVPVDLLESNAGVSRDKFDRLNPANINFETTTAWIELNGNEELLNTDVTAIVLIQDRIEPRNTAVFGYEIIPEGNHPNSKYVVSANMIATGFPTVLKTNIDIGTVVQRTIEGTVWYDGNKNGIMEDNESKAENIMMEIINSETGEIASDVFGNPLNNITTDEQGSYCVKGLTKGTYQVRFSLPENTYVTEKNVGNDEKVNSKINTDIQDNKVISDVLVKLNTDNLSELENEEYINLGLIQETGIVEIQYVEKIEDSTGSITENQIRDSIEISGPIDSSFNIANKEINIANYQRTTDEFEKEGFFTKEKQIIKIYYEKLPGGTVTVKHILVNADLSESIIKTEYIQKDIGEPYETSRLDDTSYIISKIRPEPSNTLGYISEEPIEVNYYYERIEAGDVIIRYVRKYTPNGAEEPVEIQILSPIVLKGYIGEQYTTSRINIEGYSPDVAENEPTGTGIFTEEEQIVTYYYTKPEEGMVTVKYVTTVWNEEKAEYEEQEISELTILKGYVGDTYETIRKPIENYRGIAPEPTNKTGVYSEQPITVIYYYELLPKGEITVKYIDIDGNLMKDDNDNPVQPITTSDYIGKSYICTPMEFVGYSVKITTQNSKGTYTESPQEITFIYDRNYYNYKFEYYFEDLDGNYVIDNNYTVNGQAKYEDVITQYDEKTKTGFTCSRVEGVPIVIGTNENENVIKLYYDRNIYDYSVEYYYENDNGELDKKEVTEYGQAKYGDIIDKYIDKNIAGYYLKTKENYPLTITENVNNNIMKLYYYKQDATINIKYIDVDTFESIVQDKYIYGKVGQSYDVSNEIQEIENYRLMSQTDNLVGIYIESPENNNTITVIFGYKKTGKVITKYIEKIEQIKKDEFGNEIIDTTTGKPITEVIEVEIHNPKIEEDIIGSTITVTPIAITNYTLLEGQTSQSVLVEDGETIIKYEYTGKAGGVTENHIDIITGELIEQIYHEGRQGDYYSYPAKTFEGYDLYESKLPTNSEGTMQENTIEVSYYYIKRAQVLVEYVDEISGEKILVDDKDLTETINGHENDSYQTNLKDISGYVHTKTEGETSGNMKVTVEINEEDGTKIFNNITEVTYYYKKIAGGVIERHIDIISNEIIEEKLHQGNEMDKYSITNKEFTGYDLVEEKKPDNAEGNMTVEPIIVNYYYIKEASVKIKYIDKTNNVEIIDNKIIYGHENDPYESQPEDLKYYKLIEEPENKTGEMKASIIKNDDGTITLNNVTEVIYYYERLKFNFKIEQEIVDIIANGQKIAINDSNIGKIDFKANEIEKSNVEITYKITITNDSDIEGIAYAVIDVPDGFHIVETDGWIKRDGNLVKTIDNLTPKESKAYLIKLGWNYNTNNEIGIKQNIAQIISTENDANFEEITLEDNISTTEVIITISTGIIRNPWIKIVFVFLIVLAFLIIVNKKKISRNRKMRK